jgi:hypothetical protein
MPGLIALLIGAFFAQLILYNVIRWILQKLKIISTPIQLSLAILINAVVVVLALVAAYFGHDGELNAEEWIIRPLAGIFMVIGLWVKANKKGVKV